MKAKVITTIIITLFLASILSAAFYVMPVSAPVTNIVANPSFETPEVTHGECWGIWASGTAGLGWSVEWMPSVPAMWDSYLRPSPAYIELQENGIYFGLTAYDGDQWAELDSDWFGPGGPSGEPASIAIYQDLSTVAGVSYELSFVYSPRPGALNNILNVYWDGDLIATISITGSAHWTTVTYTVIASSGTTTLRFEEAGTPDGLGMLLDDVCVTPIYYTVTVEAEGDGDALAVSVDWMTEAPSGSGTDTTPFDLEVSIDDVTLEAPLTHIQDYTFYVFDHWSVDGYDYPDGQNSITFSVSEDVTATAHYTKLVSVEKELTGGSDVVVVGVEVDFGMCITFHAFADVTGVTVVDGIGADLVLDSSSASTGFDTVTSAKAGKGKMGATIVTWTIGTPDVCEDYTLDLTVHTGLNPMLKQEYTQAGDHYLNSGPVVYFTYDGTPYTLHGPSVKVTAVNLLGDWILDFYWIESPSHWVHDMTITSVAPSGDFSGTGGYPVTGPPYSHPWTLTGTISGNTVTFTIVYGSGAPNPGYTVYATGTIASDGSLSGTASSNAGQTFTWTATRP